MALPFAVAIGAQAPVKAQMDALKPLLGVWRCDGTFVANEKRISAIVEIRSDEKSGAMIVRHDDLPPNAYHALEIWAPTGAALLATIVDPFSGARLFSSNGLQGGAIEWTRRVDGVAKEAFRYSHVSTAGFTVDWLTFNTAGQASLGDRLTCERA